MFFWWKFTKTASPPSIFSLSISDSFFSHSFIHHLSLISPYFPIDLLLSLSISSILPNLSLSISWVCVSRATCAYFRGYFEWAVCDYVFCFEKIEDDGVSICVFLMSDEWIHLLRFCMCEEWWVECVILWLNCERIHWNQCVCFSSFFPYASCMFSFLLCGYELYVLVVRKWSLHFCKWNGNRVCVLTV